MLPAHETRTILAAGILDAPELIGLLQSDGFRLSSCESLSGLLPEFDRLRPTVVIVSCGPTDGARALEAIHALRQRERRAQIVLVVSTSSEDLAVAALQAGVKDYIRPPIVPAEVAGRIRRLVTGPRQRADVAPDDNGPAMIGDTGVMREVRAYLAAVAAHDANVLITGETGTGKELAAAHIHRMSPRGRRPFVSVNCAAIPDSLVESEMFGYERGAFTGAVTPRPGILQQANTGTAFLDEIGDMQHLAQAKMLRAIDAREVRPLGATRATQLDIRIIAATNHNLEQAIQSGTFRKDLYFRLKVAQVHLPALRERQADIPQLFQHYIAQLNRRYGRQVEGLTDDALAALVGYGWPGNVRELKNVVEVLFLTNVSGRISTAAFPRPLLEKLGCLGGVYGSESERLLAALSEAKWNRSRAAERLRWSRMTLYRKMARYNIVPPAEATMRPRRPKGTGPGPDRKGRVA